MQFSRAYRKSIVDNLKTTFAYSSSTGAAQTTYFFSGEAPSLDDLTRTLEAEWENPTGARLAPTDSLSKYNGQLVGYCPDFLKSMAWSSHDQSITLADDLNESIDSATANYTAPVAVFGEPKQPTIVQGFDHETRGDQTVTWALTLWTGTFTYAHTIYVLHHVGTLYDANAEIVVQSALLTTTDPELAVINVYSPVL